MVSFSITLVRKPIDMTRYVVVVSKQGSLDQAYTHTTHGRPPTYDITHARRRGHVYLMRTPYDTQRRSTRSVLYASCVWMAGIYRGRACIHTCMYVRHRVRRRRTYQSARMHAAGTCPCRSCVVPRVSNAGHASYMQTHRIVHSQMGLSVPFVR